MVAILKKFTFTWWFISSLLSLFNEQGLVERKFKVSIKQKFSNQKPDQQSSIVTNNVVSRTPTVGEQEPGWCIWYEKGENFYQNFLMKFDGVLNTLCVLSSLIQKMNSEIVNFTRERRKCEQEDKIKIGNRTYPEISFFVSFNWIISGRMLANVKRLIRWLMRLIWGDRKGSYSRRMRPSLLITIANSNWRSPIGSD